MANLEDLCIPIAKIRLVADILDIEHYGVKYEHDFVEIPGQSVVGAHCTLNDVATEIEQVTRQEFDKWWGERKQYKDTIDKLKLRIKQRHETAMSDINGTTEPPADTLAVELAPVQREALDRMVALTGKSADSLVQLMFDWGFESWDSLARLVEPE